MSRLFSLAIISIVLIYAVESFLAGKTLSGKVTHIGSSHLEKNSKVHVELRDTTLMDTASKLISETVITDATTFPISYKIKYNPSDIKAGQTYSMQVRINGPDGKLQFINDVHTRAQLTGSTAPETDVAVIRIGGSPTTHGTKPGGNKACGPVNCRGRKKTCAYGYQKKDGCEICKCNDPCNPPGKSILCGPNQRCHVEKKSDGTFGTRCDTASSKKGKDGAKGSKGNCHQPKVIGNCRAALPRFYYNSATKGCEAFSYGGCGGNENNFKTKNECETSCKA